MTGIDHRPTRSPRHHDTSVSHPDGSDPLAAGYSPLLIEDDPDHGDARPRRRDHRHRAAVGPRLAGGTGTISLRTLNRFRGAEVTVLDQDPVLLALAAASLDGRGQIVAADLATPAWTADLPHRRYDAVLTATALHWLPSQRLTALYAEIRDLLRPGGIIANADHMPDDGLPGLTKRLLATEEARRKARYATGAAVSWRATGGPASPPTNASPRSTPAASRSIPPNTAAPDGQGQDGAGG